MQLKTFFIFHLLSDCYELKDSKLGKI